VITPEIVTPEVEATQQDVATGDTPAIPGETPAGEGGGETEVLSEELNIEAPGTKQATQTPFDTEQFLAQSAFGQTAKVLQGVGYDLDHKAICKITQSESVAVNGVQRLKIQGIATRGNIVNANGFVYPTSVWQSNMEYMNSEASNGKFVGKLEHPDVDMGLQDVAILFHKFWLEQDEVFFEGIVVPTDPHGKNLQTMIEAGVAIDLSSRGYGSVVQQDWQGVTRSVIQSDFICTAIDAVWHGASTGSSVKSATYQSVITSDEEINTNKELQQAIMADEIEVPAAALVAEVVQSAAQIEARSLRLAAELNSYRADVVQSADLSPLGKASLTAALAQCATLETVHATKESLLPILQATFPVPAADTTPSDVSSTYAPKFFVKQSKEELAPKTVGEMFDRMVADIPNSYPGMTQSESIPSHFRSPRACAKQVMVNIARQSGNGFNGRAAARALLAMEQGRTETANDILTQSFSADSTIANGNVDNDGAPMSAPLIFPLVRRVYPMYILNEIAAIQPMDRPTGKIFYIDHLRTADPTEGTEKRIDLNTSANPFNPTYADNNVEGATAKLIRMRLNSVMVEAVTKKLGAQWSIEEMQDLRAYHNLDASVELMTAVAREMAQEINMEVLNDMIAQATGGARTYGTGLPTGWSGGSDQEAWDSYIWVYLQALSNDIFGKRNAGATHLVVGMDAALSLAKSGRGVFNIGGSDASGDMGDAYPGTTFFGNVNAPTGDRYKVFKTNYWGTGTANANKIMVLRKGADWSDTAYIYAPYTDYMTPQFTDPEDFSQKQGVMNRSARKVVVSDNIATLTVSAGTAGVPL
jgi:hypothetical protein